MGKVEVADGAHCIGVCVCPGVKGGGLDLLLHVLQDLCTVWFVYMCGVMHVRYGLSGVRWDVCIGR